METHICILQSALDLQQQGYQVFVVEDAVSSRSTKNHDNASHAPSARSYQQCRINYF
jgi:nicotinamidase-related amidase